MAGANPVPPPLPAVYLDSNPAGMAPPIALAVAANAGPLNGEVTATVPMATAGQSAFPLIVRLSTDLLPPVFPAIALAQTASLTTGAPLAALMAVPRAVVLTRVAPMAVALKGAVDPKLAVLMEGAAPRRVVSRPSP
jgi:hypothetical protein